MTLLSPAGHSTLAMPTEAHLQIYNPAYQEQLGDFPQFSLLPKELRLQIWRHALQRYRFVKVKIPILGRHFEDVQQEQLFGGLEEELPIVRGHQILSKFLRVNSESREAALRFYRVHVPCRFKSGKSIKPGTLFFNPEFDILEIHPGWRKNIFAELVCGLKKFDPRGVGLLNLAFDPNGSSALRYQTELSDMDPLARETFLTTMSQLHEVFFLCIENAGRMYHSWTSGIHSMVDRIEFHKSCPVASKIPSFDRVARDPRPISEDLLNVFVGTSDPRNVVFFWRKLLQSWGIPQFHPSRYRFLVSARRPAKEKIRDRANAEEWLREEWDKCWLAGLDEVSIIKAYKPRIKELRSAAELERISSTKNAIGFWLFPVEALGPLPPDEEEHADSSPFQQGKRVLDMSAYWPELGLSYLP